MRGDSLLIQSRPREGTVEAFRAPRKKTLGAGIERHHIWSRLLTSHEDIRVINVTGHASKTEVHLGRAMVVVVGRDTIRQTSMPKLEQTHTSLQQRDGPQRRTSLSVTPAGASALRSKVDRSKQPTSVNFRRLLDQSGGGSGYWKLGRALCGDKQCGGAGGSHRPKFFRGHVLQIARILGVEGRTC